MQKHYEILAISGSLRKDSYNTALLHTAKELSPDRMNIEIYVPRDLPLFSKDLEDDLSDEVQDYKNKIADSDGLIFSVPEHNFSISAAMKNAIEWGNRPYGDNSFFNKPAAIMGVSTSKFATVRAQNHLRQIFQDLSIVTFNWPTVMIGNAKENFQDGVLVDKKGRRKVKESLVQLIQLIDLLPEEELVFSTD